MSPDAIPYTLVQDAFMDLGSRLASKSYVLFYKVLANVPGTFGNALVVFDDLTKVIIVYEK